LRFWDFQDGEILVAGQSVQGLPTDAVRRHFTVVSQNSYFFNATVRENLLLGNPGASSEELEAATSRAQICDVLAALPHGYETRIGERGSRLSGGERQRMAIARALLKQAPVLLLDEPTANLDPSTARGLLETLFSLMRERQRSTLMITHLLWGMEHFDEIIVLDAGRIIERGSHRSLLAEGGFYHHLWKLQSEALWI
jgi:ATP-binding cassette subfamily C protein CydC